VINYSTFCRWSTWSRTRIHTFEAHACFVWCTFWWNRALWSTVWWWSNVL